jgi:hypothetical protein
VDSLSICRYHNAGQDAAAGFCHLDAPAVLFRFLGYVWMQYGLAIFVVLVSSLTDTRLPSAYLAIAIVVPVISLAISQDHYASTGM